MNYLCVAVKKEVITEIFYSRDEALAYFQQKHGNRIVEKMEESERRLENQITILGRKLEKYKDQPEMRQRLSDRRQAAEEKWRDLERWLNGEDERKPVYMEETFDRYKERLLTEDEELFFHMAGIYCLGTRYKVAEEKHYYMCRLVEDMEGSSEAVRHLPEKMAEGSHLFYVCAESPETVKRYRQQISKIRAQVRRDYNKNRTLMKNPGIFREVL